jgi:cytochrome c oxidase subunit II
MMSSIIQRASTYAGNIDFLIELIAVIVGFWFFLSIGIFFYFLYRFRRSASPKAEYISGELHHEKKWIHIAHNLVLVCDVFILIFAIKTWYHVKQQIPETDQTVQVIGQQWAWSFVHPGADGELNTPDDIKTVEELHIKVGDTYKFELTARDVMHSFSIPVFRLKQDAVPGRVITGWFEATETGTFDIQCAEMCGIGHGIMVARLVIHTSESFEKWVSDNTPEHSGFLVGQVK